MLSGSSIQCCTFSVLLAGLLTSSATAQSIGELAKLTPPTLAGDTCAGVDIDGNFAIMGAPRSDLAATNAGAAYVWRRRPDGTWILDATLLAGDPNAGDNFGVDVAISGHTVIVGAPLDDEAGLDAGAAYVFTRQGGTWIQVKKLMGSSTAAGDHLGTQIAIDRTTTVLGAQSAGAGVAFVFDRDEGGLVNWGEIAVLTAPTGDDNAADAFGKSVAVHDKTIVIGAMLDDEMALNAGAAYIFEFGTTAWNFVTKITASDPFEGAMFGHAVDVSDDNLVVTAIELNTGFGSVYVFERNAGLSGWSQAQKLSAPLGSNGEFGRGVAIEGDTVAVTESTDNFLSDSALHVFWLDDGGIWNLQESFVRPCDFNFGDRFGHYLALDGCTAIIASNLDDHDGQSDAGSAFTFSVASLGGRKGDLNGDGAVSVADLLILLVNWGICP